MKRVERVRVRLALALFFWTHRIQTFFFGGRRCPLVQDVVPSSFSGIDITLRWTVKVAETKKFSKTASRRGLMK